MIRLKTTIKALRVKEGQESEGVLALLSLPIDDDGFDLGAWQNKGCRFSEWAGQERHKVTSYMEALYSRSRDLILSRSSGL